MFEQFSGTLTEGGKSLPKVFLLLFASLPAPTMSSSEISNSWTEGRKTHGLNKCADFNGKTQRGNDEPP